MPGIIVKALRKRNETGLVPQSALGGCREWRVPSIISADQYVQKYAARAAKSVQVCSLQTHGPPEPRAMVQLPPMKVLSQRGIPLLLGYEDIIL